MVLDCNYGAYTPQNPNDVVELYRDEEYIAGGEERETGHIKPEYIDRYALSNMLGGTTLTPEEAYELLDMEPEQVKERVRTAADVLMYMLAAKIGDCGGDRCKVIGGKEWHYNLNAFEVMEQRLANCGAWRIWQTTCWRGTTRKSASSSTPITSETAAMFTITSSMREATTLWTSAGISSGTTVPKMTSR